MENITQKSVTLDNGVHMPLFGLGTSDIKEQDDVQSAIEWAYEAGYRMIDTAYVYKNEKLIGDAIRKLNINREELFLITKIPATNVDATKAYEMLNESISNLQVDYIDMVLLHWPGFKDVEERLSVWRVLEDFYHSGKIRALGVSNFLPRHLETILNSCKVKPTLNQFELHPLFIDKETIEYCQTKKIQVQGYSPFARFNDKLIKNQKLIEISQKHSVTCSQILMRWFLQHNYSVIPKSTKKERIFQNVDIDHFSLSEEEMETLDSLHCDFKIISKWDPRSVLN